MKKAFTLAEIMIVLSVIAVLTAVLLPAARNATPNEDLMKFKKGHLALINSISELVNSDKYYLNGDLGIRPNNTLIDGTHEGDNTYFCNTLADVLNPKTVNCIKEDSGSRNYKAQLLRNEGSEIEDPFSYLAEAADTACIRQAKDSGIEIVTSDNISYYQGGPSITFGMSNAQYDTECQVNCSLRTFFSQNNLGFKRLYKFICMDIDGAPSNITRYDCVNECPFGYALRVDGKVLLGKRATEWFKKSIQEK